MRSSTLTTSLSSSATWSCNLTFTPHDSLLILPCSVWQLVSLAPGDEKTFSRPTTAGTQWYKQRRHQSDCTLPFSSVVNNSTTLDTEHQTIVDGMLRRCVHDKGPCCPMFTLVHIVRGLTSANACSLSSSLSGAEDGCSREGERCD